MIKLNKRFNRYKELYHPSSDLGFDESYFLLVVNKPTKTL